MHMPQSLYMCLGAGFGWQNEALPGVYRRPPALAYAMSDDIVVRT